MLEDLLKLDEIKMFQKVKNFAEVKTEQLSYPLYVSEKYDGVFCCAIKENNKVHIISRTGKPYLSMKHIEDEISEYLLDGHCYLFEAYIENTAQSVISGYCRDTVNQHPDLKAYVHTVLDLVGDRLVGNLVYSNPLKDFVVSEKGNLIFIPFKVVYSLEELQPLADELFAKGKEGIIVRQKADYTQGTKNDNMFRIKENIDFDLEVVDVFEGKNQFTDMLGGVVCRFENDKLIRVGSGFTKQQRAEFWADPSLIIGKVIEVKAMKKSSKGDLREARFKRIRNDKTKGDF